MQFVIPERMGHVLEITERLRYLRDGLTMVQFPTLCFQNRLNLAGIEANTIRNLSSEANLTDHHLTWEQLDCHVQVLWFCDSHTTTVCGHIHILYEVFFDANLPAYVTWLTLPRL